MANLRDILTRVALAVGVAVACRLFGLDLAQTFIGMAATAAFGLVFSWMHRLHSREREGWHQLSPGAMEWAAFLGCGAFALLMAYVYNFVGSARPDAARQMSYVFWMMIAFGAGSVISALKIAFEIIRWNDVEIQQRTMLLQVRTLPWAELRTVERTSFGHGLRLTGAEGTCITIPLHRDGVGSLIALLVEPAEV